MSFFLLPIRNSSLITNLFFFLLWLFFSFCFLVFILFFFNWSTVDLQCCANLCCIAYWLSYTHLHIFKYSLPLWFITGYSVQFPELSIRTLLCIHSKCNSLHLPTANPQSFPLHPPLPWQPQACFHVCESVSVCR